MDDLQPLDEVTFAGPPGSVLRWPEEGERGVVERVNRETVRVVWESSTLLATWPREWIKRH